jgi:hypothetical protein
VAQFAEAASLNAPKSFVDKTAALEVIGTFTRNKFQNQLYPSIYDLLEGYLNAEQIQARRRASVRGCREVAFLSGPEFAAGRAWTLIREQWPKAMARLAIVPPRGLISQCPAS